MFSTFPAGRPGVGLLLLRVAVGILASVGGVLYLAGDTGEKAGPWIVGLLVIVSGILLTLGLLTPVAAAIVVCCGVGIALSWLPAPPSGPRWAPLDAWLVVIVAVATLLLGPGAYSLDARLFGRREIVVPPPPHRPSS